MTARVFLLAILVTLMSHSSAYAAPPTTDPVEPVAYTPDADTVFQLGLSQSTYPSIPSSLLFTEYTFGNEQLAADYFWSICSYLESDMNSTQIPVNPLELRESANPQCGYALSKGTQASTAVLYGTRVLTIWVFGPAFDGPVGEFLTVFMWTASPIVDEALLPNPATVKAPWRVDGPKVDITDYARTAVELRP